MSENRMVTGFLIFKKGMSENTRIVGLFNRTKSIKTRINLYKTFSNSQVLANSYTVLPIEKYNNFQWEAFFKKKTEACSLRLIIKDGRN